MWGRLFEWLSVLFVAFVAVTTVLVAEASASSRPDAGDPLEWTATINGADVGRISANDPLQLHPRSGAQIMVSATNNGTSPITVRSVRLDGQVLGLTFFTYTTRVDLVLEPGDSGSRQFLVDLFDLDGQATGLLPARLTLLDGEFAAVSSRDITVDVRGSVVSVYGVFGIAAAAITALLLITLLFRLATRRLPANRWSRATRFAVVGVGIGITLTFTMSAVRVLTPNPATWLSFVVTCSLAAFVLGFLSPTPVSLEDEEGEGEGEGEGEEREGEFAAEGAGPAVTSAEGLHHGGSSHGPSVLSLPTQATDESRSTVRRPGAPTDPPWQS